MGLPDAAPATQSASRFGWLGRIALWFGALVVLDTAALVGGLRYAFGQPLVLGVLIVLSVGFLTAWGFGLFGRRGGVIVAVAGTLVAPLAAIALLIALYYATTVTRPPPLLRAVDRGQTWEALDASVTKSLGRSFPQGSREADLLAVLNDQKFIVDRQRKTAVFTWSSVVCSNTLRVRWTATSGRLAAIDGRVFAACL